MILPTIRASLSRNDALHLVELLGRHDVALRTQPATAWRTRGWTPSSTTPAS